LKRAAYASTPAQYVVRRSSELNAIRLRTILLLACGLFAAHGTTQPSAAAPANTLSRGEPTAQRPLTRNDVELLLREARSAISRGKLDEAESLVTRAENARIHYSLFHFGPTPLSVRRELNRARKTQGSSNNNSSDAPKEQPLNPFATKRSAPAGATVDPFAARSQPAMADIQPNSAPVAGTNYGDNALPSEQSVERLPSLGKAVENPFLSKPGGAAAPLSKSNGAALPARYDATAAPYSDVAQTAWDQRPGPTTTAPKATALPPVNEISPPNNVSLALPEIPLPPARTEQQSRPAATNDTSSVTLKRQALDYMAEARRALDAGNIEQAEKLARAAAALGMPESQFLPDEDRPSLLASAVVRAKGEQGRSARETNVLPAATENVTPTTTDSRYAIRPREVPAATAEPAAISPGAEEQLPTPALRPAPINASNIEELSQAVNLPAEAGKSLGALRGEQLGLPRENLAIELRNAETESSGASPSLLDQADQSQQLMARQLYAEIGERQSEAIRLRETDPERALATLREAQQLIANSSVPESMRRELLSRTDKTLADTEKYIKDHAAEIELEQRNADVLADLDRDRELKRKIEQEIAESVEEFNRLRDEHRYAEAEIVARRLYELAPENPVAQQILQMAKFIRREMMNRETTLAREDGNWMVFDDVEQASISNVGDDNPLVFDKPRWEQYVKNRLGSKERNQRRTERELEIENRLKTPVQVRYEDRPLGEVMSEMSELTGVNIHLDPRGLEQEGYNHSTPVTINLNKEISLESALNLILEPLHLSYVIKDDVLKITSEQLRDGEIYPLMYDVADLVIPIPNFVPHSNIGLQGLINESMAAAGYGHGVAQSGPSVLVSEPARKNGAAANDRILAQQFNAAPAAGPGSATVPIGAGPGGLGGGANADFDSLIDLIVSTVSTETWAENGGGEAEIRPFPTNLSLVISQTQAVHEEIADLLAQLRRLQDLQVTIEVRFITLSDSFFERIGIDFDVDINDNGFNDDPATTNLQPFGLNSNTVGLVQSATEATFPTFTSDLDIPFRQGSFNVTQPLFGGFDAGSAANFGFAILSDIEAFFLIQAAQGDTRTNVLNAPKVTLFNGQTAFVADAAQRPFVIGVIPVVGEFAAAQQPVIVVLNEGTMMTIQAVVSDDRRYVRMTIVPFFTQIGDVDEFTFEGSTSSTNSSSATDSDEDGKNESEEESDEEIRTGVTVQLPTFRFVSVVTTVSVPDGGTVLLGGIKRLDEGRNEFGVPLLSKVPYVNRLFRNVGIGRTTRSLMMMVTPRIIIQEEEEERLGIAVP
jgi:general secretion pathway protein D